MIETQRLILRQWQQTDVSQFAQICADPEVMAFFPATLSAAETASLVARFTDSINDLGYGFFAAELKAEQRCIGFIGLNLLAEGLPFAPCVDIGWRLDKSVWGLGLATEGARAALQYGFETLDLAQIVSMTAVLNTASERVMQKIGMHKQSETFKHPKLPKGHRLEEHVLYTLSQQEYWQQCESARSD